jgi:hypothetical protein
MYQNASTCKERNQLNETNLRIQELRYRGASSSGTALRMKVAALCQKKKFWNGFNFWPGPSAESQLNWI